LVAHGARLKFTGRSPDFFQDMCTFRVRASLAMTQVECRCGYPCTMLGRRLTATVTDITLQPPRTDRALDSAGHTWAPMPLSTCYRAWHLSARTINLTAAPTIDTKPTPLGCWVSPSLRFIPRRLDPTLYIMGVQRDHGELEPRSCSRHFDWQALADMTRNGVIPVTQRWRCGERDLTSDTHARISGDAVYQHCRPSIIALGEDDQPALALVTAPRRQRATVCDVITDETEAPSAARAIVGATRSQLRRAFVNDATAVAQVHPAARPTVAAVRNRTSIFQAPTRRTVAVSASLRPSLLRSVPWLATLTASMWTLPAFVTIIG